jgi:hypothetical protein
MDDLEMYLVVIADQISGCWQHRSITDRYEKASQPQRFPIKKRAECPASKGHAGLPQLHVSSWYRINAIQGPRSRAGKWVQSRIEWLRLCKVRSSRAEIWSFKSHIAGRALGGCRHLDIPQYIPL